MIALRSILHPARDEEALQRGMEQDVVAGVPESVVEELKALGIPEGSYRFAPLSMAQRSAARRLTASFRDVPHFSLASRVEVDRLAALREGFPRGADGVRPTFNDLIIKAAALALQAVPEANASFTEKGLVFHAAADIAVAVALPDGGLVTPIVRNAGSKALYDIAREMKSLAERARRRALTPPEYFGGTFTISNLGMMGITRFTSIINPPQAGILSVGRAERHLVLREGDRPVPASIVEMTLTCDHRAVDGATGARWLQAFGESGVVCVRPVDVNNNNAVMRDAEYQRLGRVSVIDHPTQSKVRQMGALVRVSHTTPATPTVAPGLGQHTEQILGELGYDAAAIAELRTRSAIRG